MLFFIFLFVFCCCGEVGVGCIEVIVGLMIIDLEFSIGLSIVFGLFKIKFWWVEVFLFFIEWVLLMFDEGGLG